MLKAINNLEPVKNTHGSVSYRMSLTAGESTSGNLISNDTNKSPFLDGSLANGRPCPCNRLTVVGLITSDFRFIGTFLSVRVGTTISVPQRA